MTLLSHAVRQKGGDWLEIGNMMDGRLPGGALVGAGAVFGALAVAHATALIADRPAASILSHWADARVALNEPISSADLEAHGKALRAALQKTYENIFSSGKPLGIRTDITQSVLPYISAGISFGEAEAILRAAGFHVNADPQPDQANNPSRSRDWCGVVAEISPLAEKLFTKVSVYVTLLPRSPGDYTTVESVNASLFVSMP